MDASCAACGEAHAAVRDKSCRHKKLDNTELMLNTHKLACNTARI